MITDAHHPACEPDNEDCASYDCPCPCHPDDEMERRIDAVIDSWAAAGYPRTHAQRETGYERTNL